MPRLSAGLLLYRRTDEHTIEVLLVHPGGPFWAKKDDGAWSLPKGEYAEDEDPRAVAAREFEEELGVPPPAGPEIDLGEVRQAGGKHVRAWAVGGDLAVEDTVSNTFDLEWPPKSGRTATFPEVDRAGWFPMPEARVKLLKSQLPFLDRLADALSA